MIILTNKAHKIYQVLNLKVLKNYTSVLFEIIPEEAGRLHVDTHSCEDNGKIFKNYVKKDLTDLRMDILRRYPPIPTEKE